MTLRRRIGALEAKVAAQPIQELPAEPHPLPDLTGQDPRTILEALLGALTAAHPDAMQAAADGEELDPCPSCSATIDVAFRFADPADRTPINPVMRILSHEFAWLDEMKRWSHLPGAGFNRPAWEAEQERQDGEHFYTNRYRGQIPPWVIVDGVPTAPR